MTPRGVLGPRPRLLVVLGSVFLALALAAWINDGWLLLRWDEPVQRVVEDARPSWLTPIVKRVSFLGSTFVVLAAGAVLVTVAWGRCRAVATVVLVVMTTRPLLEFAIKTMVDRQRPELRRLVEGNGPSFPSGHVMAAVSLWGLVPLVVTLFTQNRRIWWLATGLSMALILGISASRTYLGVHWLSDVVAGLVVGSFILLAAELLLLDQHRRHPCAVAHAAGWSTPGR